MPPPIQIPDDTGIGYLIILLFTLMGTAARVFYNWMTGNPVSFVFTIGQIVISIFASSLTLMIVVRLEWKIYGISVACGLAAWMGIKILDFFEKRLLERLEGKRENK
ncbi:hypothetical protein I7V27_04075 [Lelliottia amnigena]|uniref:Holin n=1 Tax=Lelliottia amnigena TaxID=61646 RepID=A0AAP2ACJ8_LELAM|nr:hypothetical protein [Lelliottia amnigena]MBL5898552.1 hypothetical protein [Lelliottia amnigena]MBL5933639.1 hypothetical protein [Lelliottia amnigena]